MREFCSLAKQLLLVSAEQLAVFPLSLRSISFPCDRFFRSFSQHPLAILDATRYAILCP